MNSMGLNLIMRLGCLCSKERLQINGKSYFVRERLGEGYVVQQSGLGYGILLA